MISSCEHSLENYASSVETHSPSIYVRSTRQTFGPHQKCSLDRNTPNLFMKNRCYALLVEIRSYGGDRRARSDDRESFDENLLCGMRLQKLRFVMIWPISSLATLATAISGSSTTRRRNAGVLQIRNSLNMTRNGEWFHPRWRKIRAPTLCKAIFELA